MKRAERNEFTSIRKDLKKGFYGPFATLTIPVDASTEYKKLADDLFRKNGFHPCAVKTDPKRFDEKERVLYIKNPEGATWTDLYTEEERNTFEKAIEA